MNVYTYMESRKIVLEEEAAAPAADKGLLSSAVNVLFKVIGKYLGKFLARISAWKKDVGKKWIEAAGKKLEVIGKNIQNNSSDLNDSIDDFVKNGKSENLILNTKKALDIKGDVGIVEGLQKQVDSTVEAVTSDKLVEVSEPDGIIGKMKKLWKSATKKTGGILWPLLGVFGFALMIMGALYGGSARMDELTEEGLAQKMGSLESFWSFIKGMITNMPLIGWLGVILFITAIVMYLLKTKTGSDKAANDATKTDESSPDNSGGTPEQSPGDTA